MATKKQTIETVTYQNDKTPLVKSRPVTTNAQFQEVIYDGVVTLGKYSDESLIQAQDAVDFFAKNFDVTHVTVDSPFGGEEVALNPSYEASVYFTEKITNKHVDIFVSVVLKVNEKTVEYSLGYPIPENGKYGDKKAYLALINKAMASRFVTLSNKANLTGIHVQLFGFIKGTMNQADLMHEIESHTRGADGLITPSSVKAYIAEKKESLALTE